MVVSVNGDCVCGYMIVKIMLMVLMALVHEVTVYIYVLVVTWCGDDD